MFTVTGRRTERTERKGFSHRGAGTIKPVKRDAKSGSPERRSNTLSEKIPGKEQTDLGGIQSGFFNREFCCFFLHGAFGRFPGVCTKHGIFAYDIKTGAKRTFTFFLAYDRGTALDEYRIFKSDAGSAAGMLFFHETTPIIFRI